MGPKFGKDWREKRLGCAVDDRARDVDATGSLEDEGDADCARGLVCATEELVLSFVRLGCRDRSTTGDSLAFGSGGVGAGGSDVAGVSSRGTGVASGVGMIADDGSIDDV